jgi:AcrR family transcriptional regulator
MATQLERRTETQQAIVDAALELFLEDDDADASLDAVAERAGVAKSTVLYHFDNRVGLLRAVNERLAREMGSRLSPIEQYEDAQAFLRAFLRDGRSPRVRIFHQVGDRLLYAGKGQTIGDGLQSLMGALEMVGLHERTLVVATASMTMLRQVTFGEIDDETIDRFVDELFAAPPSSSEANRR